MPALDRHDAEWRSASYQQIMRDDAAEDAIYDSLSRLKAPGTEARGTDTGPKAMYHNVGHVPGCARGRHFLLLRKCGDIMQGTALGTGTLEAVREAGRNCCGRVQPAAFRPDALPSSQASIQSHFTPGCKRIGLTDVELLTETRKAGCRLWRPYSIAHPRCEQVQRRRLLCIYVEELEPRLRATGDQATPVEGQCANSFRLQSVCL